MALDLEKRADYLANKEAHGRPRFGRPLKIFDYEKAQALLRSGLTIRATAAELGIPQATLHGWTKRWRAKDYLPPKVKAVLCDKCNGLGHVFTNEQPSKGSSKKG
jgi:hypothetical protein